MARMQPTQRAKARDSMTRSDSLASMSEFGKIVPPSQQVALRKKLKPDNSIMGRLKRALGGK